MIDDKIEKVVNTKDILEDIYKAYETQDKKQKETAEEVNKPEMIYQICAMVPLLNEDNLHKLLCAVAREHSKRLQDITFPWKCREHNKAGEK